MCEVQGLRGLQGFGIFLAIFQVAGCQLQCPQEPLEPPISEISFLQLEVDEPRDPKELKEPKLELQTLQFFHQQLRSKTLKALQWSTLRHFAPRWQELDSECANIGRRYPALVSRNLSVLGAYRNYVCNVAPNWFITDPDVALTADVADLENGCINVRAKPKWIMATNGTHGYDAYRRCSGSCPDDPSWHDLSVRMVDEDILVIPSFRTIPDMEYQHSLTDVLSQAWTVLQLLNSKKKLAIYHPLQGQLLQNMGVPSEHLLEIPIIGFEAHKLLCVKPGRTLTLWRTGRPDGAEVPYLESSDPRIYADYWWRLPGYKLVPEVSDAIARHSGWADEQKPDSVLFVQRCSDRIARRVLSNEPEAVGAVTRVLVEAKVDFNLVTFCPGREDFLTQVRKVRQAKLIIGEHGGALANMLLARNGTGIIEILGSPEAQLGVPGQFPPYKSMWYGGAGAAFDFYRVVVYEPSPVGLAARLEDLQEAVQQWLSS